MVDNTDVQQHQWKTTPMEDNTNGRQHQWKTTPMEDNTNGRQPQQLETAELKARQFKTKLGTAQTRKKCLMFLGSRIPYSDVPKISIPNIYQNIFWILKLKSQV